MYKHTPKYLAGLLLLASSVTYAHSGLQADTRAAFDEAGVAYPPKSLTFIVFKKERQVQVYAPEADGDQQYIRTYPVEDVAGHLGPKLRQGDMQVPEGIYAFTDIGPTGQFHRAMHIDYPNAYDKAHGSTGGGIVFHGHTVSLGCVAVSDASVDDLYALASAVGKNNVKIIIAPEDFRKYFLYRWWDLTPEGTPVWVEDLYDNIEEALGDYPPPRTRSRLFRLTH